MARLRDLSYTLSQSLQRVERPSGIFLLLEYLEDFFVSPQERQVLNTMGAGGALGTLIGADSVCVADAVRCSSSIAFMAWKKEGAPWSSSRPMQAEQNTRLTERTGRRLQRRHRVVGRGEVIVSS